MRETDEMKLLQFKLPESLTATGQIDRCLFVFSGQDSKAAENDRVTNSFKTQHKKESGELNHSLTLLSLEIYCDAYFRAFTNQIGLHNRFLPNLRTLRMSV